MGKAQYQTRSWVFSVGFLAHAGWKAICRVFLIYICVMTILLALKVELWVGTLSLSRLLYTEEDSVGIQKPKQNWVRAATSERAVKKNVCSSVMSKIYIHSILGRGTKTMPLKVGCIASWQPQGHWDMLALLVWWEDCHHFSLQYSVCAATMAWPRERVRGLFLWWSGLNAVILLLRGMHIHRWVHKSTSNSLMCSHYPP